MSFTATTRYALVTAAILTASVIQLVRGYRPLIVIVGALAFLLAGNATVYMAGSKERAVRRKQKRDYYAGLTVLIVVLLSFAAARDARAQLLGEPPIPPKKTKIKHQQTDLEWMWQYTPPPAEGREHELIQDPHFEAFLQQNFKAPQSFWGLQTDKQRKSLAETVSDFLTIPGKAIADDNRYVTVTGAVRHLPTARGLLFADLNTPNPLVVFAAIDWIRASKTTDDPGAGYTLWLFPNQAPGPPTQPAHLSPALTRSLTRWMATPLAGSGTVQHITAAILVDPDGTPHQIPVPSETAQ